MQEIATVLGKETAQAYSSSWYKNIDGIGWSLIETKSLISVDTDDQIKALNPFVLTQNESNLNSTNYIEYKLVCNISPYLESNIVRFTNTARINNLEDIANGAAIDAEGAKEAADNAVAVVTNLQDNINAQIQYVSEQLVLTPDDDSGGIYRLYGSDY